MIYLFESTETSQFSVEKIIIMKEPFDADALIREKESLKKILSNINSKYLEKIEELSLIRRIGDSLIDITDFSSVCKSIVSVIQQELDSDNCSLMLVDDEKGEIILRAAKGPFDEEAKYIKENVSSTRFRLGESIAGHVARFGNSIRIQDVQSDERFILADSTTVEIRSLMCIPLSIGGRVIGVINLSNNTPDTFNADKERALIIIANSSAIALENTRLYAKLSQSRDLLAKENVNLKSELIRKFSPKNIIGASKAFEEILRKIDKISDVNVNVLITGESGTGKELVARTLHYSGIRAEGPFIAVNCAALPENLLESELFGIEKGVATGVEKRIGKFELANNGTIFLDEIGDMSLATQAKILRALQEKEIQKVGGNKTIELDVRILSATNKDLEQAIKKSEFREDLYYRLKVVDIKIPPLRERKVDIPLLANFFLKKCCKKHSLGEKWFARETLDMLVNSPWKGNVRELENAVEQAVILSSSETINSDDISLSDDKSNAALRIYIPDNRLDYKEVIREISEQAEKRLIQKALKATGNNQSQAAKLLGIGRRTLINKLHNI